MSQFGCMQITADKPLALQQNTSKNRITVTSATVSHETRGAAAQMPTVSEVAAKDSQSKVRLLLFPSDETLR